MPVHIEHEGMFPMKLRERANAGRREELVLVENVFVDVLKLFSVGDGQKKPRALISLLAHVHMIEDVWIVREEPFHALAKTRQARQVLRLKRLDREKWNQ